MDENKNIVYQNKVVMSKVLAEEFKGYKFSQKSLRESHLKHMELICPGLLIQDLQI